MDKSAASRRMLEQMMDGPLPTRLRYQIGGLLQESGKGIGQSQME
jgi:hypothetical protein